LAGLFHDFFVTEKTSGRKIFHQIFPVNYHTIFVEIKKVLEKLPKECQLQKRSDLIGRDKKIANQS
jgi:hypothetical protein